MITALGNNRFQLWPNINGKGRANQINTSSFAYDANDYRINKNSDRYYLEGEHIEATYSSSDQLQNKYFRGVIVDEIVNGFTYHSSNANDWSNYTYHHDHLNSVTHLTGHNGSSEESTRFDAFGAPQNLSVPGTGNDLLYTGREYDRDTRLYYYRARYYDPEIGRFISEDPLGFEAGVNFYAYVHNNPVNFNDPTGNERQVTFGVSGTLFGTPPTFLVSGGGSGGMAFGVSFPDEFQSVSDLGEIQFFAQARASALLGTGAFAGVSLDASLGRTDASLPVGVTSANSFRIEANVGLIGASGGISADFDNSSFSAGNFLDLITDSNVASGRIGRGVGGMIAGGVNQTVTFASPTINEMFSSASNSFSSVFSSSVIQTNASGGFVLYPNRPNLNMIQQVYEK